MNTELATRENAQALALGTAGTLDHNPAAVYLAGLQSKRSQSTMRQALASVAGLLLNGDPRQLADPLGVQWAGLRFQHMAAIRARLAETYAPATANRLLCALRGTLKAAYNLDLIPEGDYRKCLNVKPVKGETLPAGRCLGAGELLALLQTCENDPTPAGVRDAALIACMYPGGLRRAEVVGLDLGDFDPQSGALTVRHGKGNKARITYLANGAARALRDWLAIRGAEPGPLFWPINKGNTLQARRLTHQAIYNALAKRGEAAGVADFSPHDLRRTFVSDLLDRGTDIATVAKLAGHASVTTTQRYDRRSEAAKSRAAELLHLPYRGRMV